MAREQVEDALVLLHEEEQICRELNDTEGLAQCLGNQAAVLLDAGRLDEAAEKLDEQELPCRTLNAPAITARREQGLALIRERQRARCGE